MRLNYCDEIGFIPANCQIRGRCLLLYPEFGYLPRGGYREKPERKPPSHSLYTGLVTKAIQKKITRIIDCWVDSLAHDSNQNRKLRIKTGLSFVTLTLSDLGFHDHRWIKRNMLNRFIQTAKRKWGIKSYFWKAEIQEKTTGNIHFHLLFDKFIPWQQVRQVWNSIQSDTGFLDSFEVRFGHRDPNSTDIHALYDLKNPAAYIGKYMSKNSDLNTKIQGKVYGHSDNLSKLKYPSVELSRDVYVDLINYCRERDYLRINDDRFMVIDSKGLKGLNLNKQYEKNQLTAQRQANYNLIHY